MGCRTTSRHSSPRWGSRSMRPNDPDDLRHDRLPPLGPLPPHDEKELVQPPFCKPAPPRRRRGLWRGLGFLLGGPVAAFGAMNIGEGARTIGALADRIKAGDQPDRRVRVDAKHYLDLQATAFLAGTNTAGLERLLANRRRQSAVATKSYLAGGCGFLAFWFYEAFVTPVYASLPYVLGLIALCGVFFLSAFHNALINWQARTRRIGSARDFLNADESWWPS